MSVRDDLVPALKKLRLSGILGSLDLRIDEAVRAHLSHEELLLRLLSDEVERRDTRQTQARLAHANFEHRKTLEDFDFTFNPGVSRAAVTELATCNFVGQHRNVLLVGPTGTGKSHLAQSLGHRACMAGHTALFIPAHTLFMELRAARADGSREKRLRQLAKLDLLILDDLGLRPLTDEEPLDLYDIIRSRYERAATVITSNRSVEEWYPLFRDELLASAAMDRLLHHAHVLEMTGRSYRTRGTDKLGGDEAA